MQKRELCLAYLLLVLFMGEAAASPGKCLFDGIEKQLGDFAYLRNETDPTIRRIEGLMSMGRMPQADRELRRLAAEKPDYAKAYLLSALVDVKLLDFDRALLAINRYIALKGEKNAADGYWVRAQIHFLRGRKKEALADYDRCLAQKDETYALVAREEKADLLMSEGRAKEALPILDECVAMAKDRDAGKYLGRTLARAECYDKLGMTEKALKDYRIYAARVDSVRSSLEFVRALMRTGKNAEALTAVNQILKRHQPCHQAVELRSEIREKMGDYKGALEDIETLVKVDPYSTERLAKKKALMEKIGR